MQELLSLVVEAYEKFDGVEAIEANEVERESSITICMLMGYV